MKDVIEFVGAFIITFLAGLPFVMGIVVWKYISVRRKVLEDRRLVDDSLEANNRLNHKKENDPWQRITRPRSLPKDLGL